MSRPSCRSFFFLSLLLAAVGFATSATAAITAGSLAIIGYDDSIDQFGGTDYVSIATLAPISAGEVVYLTDNGWFGSSFRGAADAFGGGTGVESISRLTFNVAIPAGTILSTFDSSTDYTWDFSSAIGLSGGGAALGNYSLAAGEVGRALPARRGGPPRLFCPFLGDAGLAALGQDQSSGSAAAGMNQPLNPQEA